MGRGVRTPSQVSRILGVSFKAATRWVELIHARWNEGLDKERLNWRRESLYTEADVVAQRAWEDALDMVNGAKERAAFLRVVLEANKRKAALCGLDSATLNVANRVDATISVDIVAKTETDLGLAPGALGSIGRDAAMLLSGQQLQHVPKILDVPVIEMEPEPEPEQGVFAGFEKVRACNVGEEELADWIEEGLPED